MAIHSYLGLVNEAFAQQAVTQDCVYSDADSDNRGGQPCSGTFDPAQLTATGWPTPGTDVQGAEASIVEVDTGDFSSEEFSWNWGTGCANIADVGSTLSTGAEATQGAADAANAVLPGTGTIVSQIGNLITDILAHGAEVHNEENEILCAVVPRAAGAMAQIVAAFRSEQLSASQANQLLEQTLSTTQQALGSEAGRGSGQGLLRNMAVVVAYYGQELPAEEKAMEAAAAMSSSSSSSGSSSDSSSSTTYAAPATASWFTEQLISGLPNWGLLAIAGGIVFAGAML
jgi:hypothetical protein